MFKKYFLVCLFFQLVVYADNIIFSQQPSAWAMNLLASMTMREKIGQLFMVAAASCFEQQEESLASQMCICPYKINPEYIAWLITEYKIGGLIFLFKSTPLLQIQATNYYQKLSKIPLLIGQDCEWGLSMRLYDTPVFAKNNVLGALKNKQLIYQLAKEIGRQCKAIGVHINFSPVVDVNNNSNNKVIGHRSFGSDPELVAQCGLLMMHGLQDAGILACAKHFPGHGDTSTDSHLQLPIIMHSLDRLHNVELFPFKKLIQAGVSAVMSAHLSIPALEKESNRPTSLSHAVVTNLLEKELGFGGLKITDGLGMQALTNYYKPGQIEPGQIELQAFLAGNDILLCPLDVPLAVELIEQAIKDKKVSIEQLDARVLKILQAKEWVGCTHYKEIDAQQAVTHLFSAETLELQKKMEQN